MPLAATQLKVDVKVLVVCRDWAHWGWLRVCLQSVGIVVAPGDVESLRSTQCGDVAQFDVLLFEAHDLDEVDLSILQRVREASPLTEVVAISAGGRVDDAVQALRSGVYAILLRPVSEGELVRTIVAASERKRRAEGRMRALGTR